MWGWDDRPGGAGSSRLIQYDEATASTAKIIPLRPWFDPPPSRAEESLVKFADENSGAAEARTVAKTAEPSLRVVAKTQAKPEAKTEAKVEAKTEAKTPPPGSTVVIEQTVPAPPLRTVPGRAGNSRRTRSP